MVIDHLNNSNLYLGLGPLIQKGFEFINNTDLAQAELGKHEIDGEDVFAIVMEYETKPVAECKYEGHHKYIDLQFLISGGEFMGVATLIDQTAVETNLEHDYEFYDIQSDLIRFEPNTFMLFYPNDLHMPGVHQTEPESVRKVVVKIKV
ncbi:MAG: YhcH/YjgK/YiaL family protein [Parvicellaceae bacterium]|jgi:YhcH/YjgK/YiaL family protein